MAIHSTFNHITVKDKLERVYLFYTLVQSFYQYLTSWVSPLRFEFPAIVRCSLLLVGRLPLHEPIVEESIATSGRAKKP